MKTNTVVPPNAVAPLIRCELGGRVRTLTIAEAEALLEHHKDAVGTNAYNQLDMAIDKARAVHALTR